MKAKRQKGTQTLNLQKTIQQIAQSSRMVKARNSVKQHQRKRIVEAIELVRGMHPDKTQWTERSRDFYKLAQQEGGLELVVALAVAGGVTKFARVPETFRVQLVTTLAEQDTIYKLDIFTWLAEECSKKDRPEIAPVQQQHPGADYYHESPSQTIPTLTGDVYELTEQDGINIVMARRSRGGILLTNTYDLEVSPFVTIQISREMSFEYAAARKQIM